MYILSYTSYVLPNDRTHWHAIVVFNEYPRGKANAGKGSSRESKWREGVLAGKQMLGSLGFDIFLQPCIKPYPVLTNESKKCALQNPGVTWCPGDSMSQSHCNYKEMTIEWEADLCILYIYVCLNLTWHPDFLCFRLCPIYPTSGPTWPWSPGLARSPWIAVPARWHHCCIYWLFCTGYQSDLW